MGVAASGVRVVLIPGPFAGRCLLVLISVLLMGVAASGVGVVLIPGPPTGSSLGIHIPILFMRRSASRVGIVLFKSPYAGSGVPGRIHHLSLAVIPCGDHLTACIHMGHIVLIDIMGGPASGVGIVGIKSPGTGPGVPGRIQHVSLGEVLGRDHLAARILMGSVTLIDIMGSSASGVGIVLIVCPDSGSVILGLVHHILFGQILGGYILTLIILGTHIVLINIVGYPAAGVGIVRIKGPETHALILILCGICHILLGQIAACTVLLMGFTLTEIIPVLKLPYTAAFP